MLTSFTSDQYHEIVWSMLTMSTLTKLFYAMAAISMFSSAAWATDYYVSANGSDSRSGTITSPWQTITRVNQGTYQPGDRILFEGGSTFNGTISFDAKDGGTPASPITVTSYGIGRAVINAGTGQGLSAYNTGGYLIQNINFMGSGVDTNTLNGIFFYADVPGGIKFDTVIIDQVDVSGFHGYGVLVGSTNGATGFKNIRMTYVTVHDNGYGGINSYGDQDPANIWYPHQNIYIGHCMAYNNLGNSDKTRSTGNGITVGSVDGAVIERSLAYGNGIRNTHLAGPGGIWAYDANNVVIQYNEAHHNQTSGAADGGGFDLDGGVSNSVLQYNYSHDNDGAGLIVYEYSGARPNKNNVVRYNISQNDSRKNGQGALLISNAGGAGVSNIEVYNNTIFQSAAPTMTYALRVTGPTTNLHVRNNILIAAPGVTLIKVPGTAPGMLFQGNNYWCNGSPLTIQWASSTYSDLAGFRLGTRQESVNGMPSGFSVDPMLTAPGTAAAINDPDALNSLTAYKLLDTSPMIDTGLTLSSQFAVSPGANGFYGNALPQRLAFDIGANESAPTSLQAGPALSAATLSATSVTSGSRVLFTVTLDAPAPKSLYVPLSSSVPTAAHTPTTVFVPGGATSATATISTFKVSSSTAVTLTATYGGITRTASLTVN